MHLCVMSLSSHDWPAHRPLGVLQASVCVRKQEKEREWEKEFASDKEVK